MNVDDKQARYDDVSSGVGYRGALPMLVSAGRFASSRDVGAHKHDGSELVYIAEGQVRVQVEDQWLPGRAGTLHVMPANRTQVQETLTYSRTSFCVFRVAPTLFDDSPRAIQLDAADPVVHWLDDLHDIYHRPGPKEDGTCSGILVAILAHLNFLDDRESSAARLHPALQRAVTYCEDHSRTNVEMAKLAVAAGVSLSHLNSLFRRQFGCGPAAYHRRLRLRHAEHLLRDPHYLVSEIATFCGFFDTNYFIRVFRGAYGASPGRWRRAQYTADSSDAADS